MKQYQLKAKSAVTIKWIWTWYTKLYNYAFEKVVVRNWMNYILYQNFATQINMLRFLLSSMIPGFFFSPINALALPKSMQHHMESTFPPWITNAYENTFNSIHWITKSVHCRGHIGTIFSHKLFLYHEEGEKNESPQTSKEQKQPL